MSSVSSKLRERVKIEQPIATPDEYGGQAILWTELATVFAEVTPVLGAVSESLFAEQRQAKAGYRVVMRYRSDVYANMRLIWKNHVLFVHSKHEVDGALQLFAYEEML